VFLGEAANQRRRVDAFGGAGKGRSSRSGNSSRGGGSGRFGSGGSLNRRWRRYGFGRSRCRSRGGRGGGTRAVDHGDNGLDGNGLAFGNFDFFEHAGGGRRNFRVHLVGGDFKERLVALDLVAGLLEPFGDGAFKDAFAHLGHDDINCHGIALLRLICG